jgi:hypothetical protein
MPIKEGQLHAGTRLPILLAVPCSPHNHGGKQQSAPAAQRRASADSGLAWAQLGLRLARHISVCVGGVVTAAYCPVVCDQLQPQLSSTSFVEAPGSTYIQQGCSLASSAPDQ